MTALYFFWLPVILGTMIIIGMSLLYLLDQCLEVLKDKADKST